MQAFHFLGWRDAQDGRLPTWQEHWTDSQRKAYDEGYGA